MAMQMRFLQTLAEVGAENNTTIVFPVPLDLLSPFLQGVSPGMARNGKPRQEPTEAPVPEEVMGYHASKPRRLQTVDEVQQG